MYYRLKSDYMLRGWKFLQTGVINRDTKEYKFFSEEKFAVLKLCDGQNDSESAIFDDKQRKIIEELQSEGYIEAKKEISPLEDVQKYKFYDNRFMESANWSITGRCNCKCRHCHMSAPKHKVEEFTKAQCMDIISQMEQCGIQKIALTGGEVLIRKDFWEIIDALTAANIKIYKILTNGLLINEKFVSELDKRNLKPEIQISFDGIGGCHDWIRDINGAEKLTLHAIKLLSKKNFNVKSLFALHKGNIKYLRETVKELTNCGVKSLFVAPITANGEAISMENKILSTEELYKVIIEYIPQYIADGVPLKANLAGIFCGISPSEYIIPFVKAPENVNIDKNCVCGSIRTSIHIDFEGFAMPCPAMGFDENGKKHFSTIFAKPLKELLNDGVYMDFINSRMRDYFKKNPQCAACKYKNRCSGGCRGNAMANNGDGDLFGVDKATCLFFKGGYYDKVLALGEKLNLKYIGA